MNNKEPIIFLKRHPHDVYELSDGNHLEILVKEPILLEEIKNIFEKLSNEQCPK